MKSFIGRYHLSFTAPLNKEKKEKVQGKGMRTSENHLRVKPRGRARISQEFNIQQSESCKKTILKLSIMWESLGHEVSKFNEKLKKYFFNNED